MVNFKPKIANGMLLWARESSGLSREEAAKKLNMSMLELQWVEDDIEDPTLSQLRAMTHVYKRPLAVFFLPRPPKTFDAMRDFRLLPNTDNRMYSPTFIDALKRAHLQQEVARELADILGDAVSPLDLTLTIDMNVEKAATELRKWLGAPAHEAVHSYYFNTWVDLIEEKSILVVQVQHVDIKEMRGCSISESPFPVIILNGSDASRGKLFTLIHELVHILQRSGAVCDLNQRRVASSARDRIEQFCNRVAAATLMPESDVVRESLVARASSSTYWDDKPLAILASSYGVSKEAMLLRLVTLKRASQQQYDEQRPDFIKLYDEQRKKQLSSSKGGPTYYQMRVRDWGRSYIAAVLEAYYNRSITESDVSDYLEVKVNHLTELEKVLTS